MVFHIGSSPIFGNSPVNSPVSVDTSEACTRPRTGPTVCWPDGHSKNGRRRRKRSGSGKPRG